MKILPCLTILAALTTSAIAAPQTVFVHAQLVELTTNDSKPPKDLSRLAEHIVRWSAGVLLVAALGYLALLIGNPKELDGKYSSYELFAHDRNDVIEFEDGLVTLETCCGDSYYGEYRPEGEAWTWEYQSIPRQNPLIFKLNEPLKISIERKLFAATIRFPDGQTMELRRRVFTSIPL